VETKLHPPLVRQDTFRRPNLEQQLCRFVTTLPLTLLSAPAGYGKTTLLAALPSLLPEYPLAWITLETEDNDPTLFIGLITTVLQRQHPECGSSVWPLISGGIVSGSHMKHAVGVLINDIVQYLSEPFILVLDDLHLVTEPAIHVALDYLLEHMPPNMHVAIGTRYDPPLRLTRLAARRQMGEIRRADLSLNQDEAGQLLNDTLGLSLTASEVATLQERTEGWPGVLCILAGPLGSIDTSEDRRQFMAALTHTEQQTWDFLAEEILRYLPDDVRKFLLQTSILVEMTPSTCQAVTGRGDSGEVLAKLYQRNLAIASLTAEAEGESVYRYHALFARLLTLQLERELQGEIVELHRRAAEVQKTPGRAIYHYLSAGLWDQAAELIINSGLELLHRGMAETVRNWYSALPIEIRSNYPYLTILMARCEIHRGEYLAAGKLLNQARRALVAAGDFAGEGDALTSLITLCYSDNDPKSAAAYVDRALKLPLNPMGQMATRLARAWVHMHNSNWEAACTDIREALVIPAVTGDRRADIIGTTYITAPMIAMPGCLQITERYFAEVSSLALPDTAWQLGALELGAWPLLLRGNLEDALKRAEAAEALRQRLGGYPFVGIEIPILLLVLYLARGDTEAAGRVMETMLLGLETVPPGKWIFHMHAAGRSLAMLGRYTESIAIKQRLCSFDDNSPFTEYLRYHLNGLLALLTGNEAEAAAALENAVKLEDQIPMASVGGSARLLQARLLLEQGDHDQAVKTAHPVLNKWNKAATPGYALLDGTAIIGVLNLMVEHNDTGAIPMLQLFSEGLNTVEGLSSSPANRMVLKGLLEPLTHREYEVLELIIAGRTNRQISAELHISNETVKSHAARIFRKLEVHSRTQAIARVRELGLSPPKGG
jgi:LuxR family maltose regulon positive regulatory protein